MGLGLTKDPQAGQGTGGTLGVPRTLAQLAHDFFAARIRRHR